jgi:hypothetical protein
MGKLLYQSRQPLGYFRPYWERGGVSRTTGDTSMTDEPSGEDKSGKSNLVGIIIVAVLVIGVGWLAHALYKNLQLQKCELEGRHDCTDMPQPDQ